MKYILLFSMVFLLSACTSSLEEGDSEAYEHSFITTLENTDREIVETKKFDDCVDPTVKMCITQVANEMAREEGSFLLCEKLQNTEDINSCKYGVVISKLASNNLLNTCDDLSDNFKRECRIASISLGATNKGDSLICNQIEEEFLESEQDNAQLRVDQCKFPIIMKKSDLKITDCGDLVSPAQKDTCISTAKNRNSQK